MVRSGRVGCAGVALLAGLLAGGCSSDSGDSGDPAAPGAAPAPPADTSVAASLVPVPPESPVSPSGAGSAAPSVVPAPTDAPAPPAPGPSRAAPAPAPTITSLAPVPDVPRRTLPPVPANGTAEVGGGVRARLLGARQVQVAARGPGETAGPGVAVQLQVSNTSAAAVPLDDARLSASYAGQEASPVSGAPARPLTGQLEPGGTRSGTYVFQVPADQRDRVHYVLSLSPGAPLVVFPAG